MNVVITGGVGFLGQRLARAILDQGKVALRGSTAETVASVTVVDQVGLAPDQLGDQRLHSVVLDLSATSGFELGKLPAIAESDVVFHLAAAVSAECETDFDLGLRVNPDGGRAILEAARHTGRRPVFVFASSLAVYGAWPTQPLPPIVTDSTLPTPRSSYGIQKFMLEQLVTDYTRKGYIDGRTVRLMTVAVRPGKPNAAASGFLSSIIREPLAGQTAICPVEPELEVALSSPESTIAGLLRAASAAESDWGTPTAVNLPAVQTTVGGMVRALAVVAGEAATELIQWERDQWVSAMVGSWPARFDSARARRLGLSADPDFETIVRRYQAQYG